MPLQRLFALLVICLSLLAPRSASAVTIDTVPVGNVGNANDPSDGDAGTPGVQNFGGVSYAYRIGMTEVTNSQYAVFLNEKARTDPHALFSASMGDNIRGGIARSGASGSYTYATRLDMGGKPVNFVNWYSAIRFVNWLNNGQGNGDTETGSYALGALGAAGIPVNGPSITRNPGAIWFLPNENEWYKAAYHHPAAQGGDADDYWDFPTTSNSVPALAAADALGGISNPGMNVANYDRGADWNGQDGNVTSVGSAGPLSASFYNTFDQGGNLSEWNETLIRDSARGLRGGSWRSLANGLMSLDRNDNNPANDGNGMGFRVATVPEPSTLALAALGAIGLLFAARRKR